MLQAGRALAALAVVFHHAQMAARDFLGIPSPRLFQMGYLGVDFFFVLSGFIIYYANWSKTNETSWPRKYAESRAARIYVPYLPVGIAMGLLYALLPGVSHGARDWSWAASLTLLPFPGGEALGVAWTLEHEVLFYFLAFFFLKSGRPLLGVFAWSALIIARNLLWPPLDAPPTSGFEATALSPINLEFAFGMTAAWMVTRGPTPRWLLGVLVALGALFIAAYGVARADPRLSFVFGLGLTCWIVPLVQAELSGRLRIGRLLLLLGNASYAIYLVHTPLLSLTARISTRVGFLENWAASIAFGFVVSALAGVAYHLMYERPMLRLVRRLIGKKSRMPGIEAEAPSAA